MSDENVVKRMEDKFNYKREKYKEREKKRDELNDVKNKAKDLYDDNLIERRVLRAINDMTYEDPYEKVKIVLDNIDEVRRIATTTPNTINQQIDEEELKRNIEVMKNIDIMEQMGILRGLLSLGIPKGADNDLYVLTDAEFKKRMDEREKKEYQEYRKKQDKGFKVSPETIKRMEEGRLFGDKIHNIISSKMTPKHRFYLSVLNNSRYWLSHIDKFINGVYYVGSTLSDTYSFLKEAFPSTALIGGAVVGGYKMGKNLLTTNGLLNSNGSQITPEKKSFLDARQFNKNLKISQRRPLLKNDPYLQNLQKNELLQPTPPPLGEFGPPQGHIISRRGDIEYLKPFITKEYVLNKNREDYLRQRNIRQNKI